MIEVAESLATLAQTYLLCLGGAGLLVALVVAFLALWPPTAPHVATYARLAGSVAAKWWPLLVGLLALAGAGGLVLALERWLRRPSEDVPPPAPPPAPVDLEHERRAIREETRREVEEIEAATSRDELIRLNDEADARLARAEGSDA